jgi:hypothetical protein
MASNSSSAVMFPCSCFVSIQITLMDESHDEGPTGVMGET